MHTTTVQLLSFKISTAAGEVLSESQILFVYFPPRARHHVRQEEGGDILAKQIKKLRCDLLRRTLSLSPNLPGHQLLPVAGK